MVLVLYMVWYYIIDIKIQDNPLVAWYGGVVINTIFAIYCLEITMSFGQYR